MPFLDQFFDFGFWTQTTSMTTNSLSSCVLSSSVWYYFLSSHASSSLSPRYLSKAQRRSKLFMLREPLLMLQCNNQLIIVHYLNYIICNVKALPEKGRFGCFLKDWEVLRGALSHRHLLYRPECSQYPWRFRSLGMAQNLNGSFQQGTCSAYSLWREIWKRGSPYARAHVTHSNFAPNRVT